MSIALQVAVVLATGFILTATCSWIAASVGTVLPLCLPSRRRPETWAQALLVCRHATRLVVGVVLEVVRCRPCRDVAKMAATLASSHGAVHVTPDDPPV